MNWLAKNQIRSVTITTAFLTALFLDCTAVAQQAVEPVHVLVATWLIKNCEVGEEKRLEIELKKGAEVARPLLLEAAAKGPDSKVLADFDRASGLRYQQRQTLLGKGEGLGLSKEDLEAARKITREGFVAREREDFDLRYRSQALLGLGIVGGDEAKSLLQRTARDKQSPLQSSAAEALRRMQEKQ